MNSDRQVEVSILVVSHDTRERTLACLDAIRHQTRSVTYEVIVVDIASRDGSAWLIGEHPIRPRLFALTENVEHAAAINLAASFASGRKLLIIGSDTVLAARAVDRLMEFAEARPDAQVWGGRVLCSAGQPVADSARTRMTPWHLICRVVGLAGMFPSSRLFTELRGDLTGRALVSPAEIVSERFMMIPRALWERLGGLDKGFPGQNKIADLCLRAHARGARPLLTQAATVFVQGIDRRPSGKSTTHRESDCEVGHADDLATMAALIDRYWAAAWRPFGSWLLGLLPLTRWLAHTVVAAASGSEELKRSAEAWRSAWHTRAAWQRTDNVSARQPPGRRGLATSVAAG